MKSIDSCQYIHGYIANIFNLAVLLMVSICQNVNKYRLKKSSCSPQCDADDREFWMFCLGGATVPDFENPSLNATNS